MVVTEFFRSNDIHIFRPSTFHGDALSANLRCSNECLRVKTCYYACLAVIEIYFHAIHKNICEAKRAPNGNNYIRKNVYAVI